MEMSGQHHAPATLSQGNSPQYLLNSRRSGIQCRSEHFAPSGTCATVRLAPSLVSIETTLPRLLLSNKGENYTFFIGSIVLFKFLGGRQKNIHIFLNEKIENIHRHQYVSNIFFL